MSADGDGVPTPDSAQVSEAQVAAHEARKQARKSAEETPRSISDWQSYIHDWAKRLGWWDTEQHPSSQIANMHAELSEAHEVIRNGDIPAAVFFTRVVTKEGGIVDKPEGFGIELADVVMRILDTCERYGIDLEHCMARKMRYNETRAYRHGGKSL